MKTKFFYSFILIAIAILSSCGGSKDAQIDGIPFQSKEDGNWGMLAPDGSVIFEGEFKSENAVYPSRNGRFIVLKVKDGESTCELYTLDEKPTELGSSFKEILPFYEDVTVAKTKKGKLVIIDKDGKEVKSISKVGGKEVKRVRGFHCGLAAYSIEKDDEVLWGFMNTDGESVISPKYHDAKDFYEGRTVVAEYKEGELYNTEEGTFYVLDKKGEEILKTKGSKYQPHFEIDGKILVSKEDGDNYKWGFVDEDGEFVFNLTNKIKGIGGFNGDVFIFSDDDGNFGLMNLDGEKLIKAKYNSLSFASDDLLIAGSRNKGKMEYELIDFDGKTVSKDTYKAIQYAFDDPTFGSQHFFVKDGKHSFTVIDESGEEMKDLPESIYKIKIEEAGYELSADYDDFGYTHFSNGFDDDYDEYGDYDSDYWDVDSVAADYYTPAPATEEPAYDYYDDYDDDYYYDY